MDGCVNVAWWFPTALFFCFGPSFRAGLQSIDVQTAIKVLLPGCGGMCVKEEAARSTALFLIEGLLENPPWYPANNCTDRLWRGCRKAVREGETEMWGQWKTKTDKKGRRAVVLTQATGVALRRQHPLSNLRLPQEIRVSGCAWIGTCTKTRSHKAKKRHPQCLEPRG